MSFRGLVLLAAAAMLGLQLLVTPVSAGQRVALVIGNASYAHAASLANPLNDATDIAAALDRLGFAVTRLDNTDQVELRRSLQQFSLAASASEMAVVFYAGHGIEVDKRNFLIPVDARLLSDADVEFETVPLDLLSRAVERAKGLRLIILDACRDNPFAVKMQRSGATRSIGRGLASVEPSGETLVAYAAKEGTVAADGDGRNSPYTTALLAHLEEPGLEVGLMFRKVRDAVLAATGGRQEPFVYGSLSSEGAYLAARPAPAPAPAPAPETVTVKGGDDTKIPDPDQVVERRIAAEKELLFWESVKDSEHVADFEAYLEQFPGGTYEALARNRLARLTEQQDEKPVVRVAVTPDESELEISPEPATPTPESIETALGLNRDERRLIQQGLASLGFDPGPADGLFGRRTRTAISAWQSSLENPTTRYLDAEAAKTLAKAGMEVAPPPGNRRDEQRQAAMDTLSRALRVAEEIEDHGDRAEALASIGNVLGKAGDVRGTAKTFRLATNAAKAENDEFDRDGALRWIAQEQARGGNVRAALATAQDIADEDTLVWALGTIAEAQAENGDAEGAAHTMSRALTIAQQIENQFGRDGSLFSVVNAQARTGDFRGALATTERIAASFYVVWGYCSIAEAQAKAGNVSAAARSVEKASKATERIVDEDDLAWALALIAEAQAEVGDTGAAARSIMRALAVAKGITDDFFRYNRLSRIAEAQLAVGDFRGALETAERSGSGLKQVETLVSIAEVQAEGGNARAAAQSMERAAVIAARIVRGNDRDWALHRIIGLQASTGDVQAALVTAQRITNEAIKSYGLRSIAEAQVDSGDVEAALGTAQKIADQSGRALALADIADAQLDNGAR